MVIITIRQVNKTKIFNCSNIPFMNAVGGINYKLHLCNFHVMQQHVILAFSSSYRVFPLLIDF